ncbi:MAG: EAL domain-containing protein [Proteobacteria bacterium]|nr:EAL domain-containing protein [Pseudomonadota bacterium]
MLWTAGIAAVKSLVQRSPIHWLVLCGGLLITGIAVGTTITVSNFRERAISTSEHQLDNTVRVLARHFDQQFEELSRIQRSIETYMRTVGVRTPEDFSRMMSSADVHEMLRSQTGDSYTGDLTLVNSDGKLINSSSSQLLAGTDVSDRSYFETLKNDPSPNREILAPVISRVTGTWKTLFIRRVTGANGEFLGLVTRSVEPEQFERFFSTVAFGENSAISMFHNNGTLLARYPRIKQMIGQNFKRGPLLQSIDITGNHATMRVTSPVDGMDRLGSIQKLRDFPISIVATTTMDTALADWREQTRFLIGVASLCALIIVIILFMIVRQLARQHRASQEQLELEKTRLDTAINNMSQGLLLFDSSERLIVCNRRYIEMYGLSPDVIKPGCTFREAIEHRQATGSFGGDLDQYCRDTLRDTAREHVVVIKTTDGRSVQITNRPVEGGGWVATHEDITERENLERERDRDRAFLNRIIDHIPTQITVKDVHNRRYVLANSVAEGQFGATRDVIIGGTAYDHFDRDMADKITQADDDAVQSRDGQFLDDLQWDIGGAGPRFITSQRIIIRDRNDEPQYLVNIVDDITERKQANDRILHLAHYDALTDLPNRALFHELLEQEIKRIGRGEQFAVLYIDIDEFKSINDSVGHAVGDELLKNVARRLRKCIRETDFVARLGGDEFAIVQTAIRSPDDVTDLVKRIHDEIRTPYECLGHQLSTDASIGIALAPQDGTDLDQLLKNADLAMYGAKADGRRTYRFFEREMDAQAKTRRQMEMDLRRIITGGEFCEGGFEIHYQPLVSLRDDKVTGCEALLRWRHPERGMISPAEFIPVAEETGLIGELGAWVLATACAEAATWPDQIKIAVNVSPVQFRSHGLPLKVASVLAASGLAANRLELEITEAVLIRDDEIALAILHQLRAIGVRIALDDFGTGYSSLSYLQRFPFDKIKIDRCFVNDIVEPDGSSSIVQAVVNIAVARNMTTTAEGVETSSQREALRALGCSEMQGYLFSAAKPAEAIQQLLRPHHPARVAVA